MKSAKGFDRVIGLSGLPALPSGDSYHVCVYFPSDGKEYAAALTTDVPEGLGGDVHYRWSSEQTATMASASSDLRVYDLDKKVIFTQKDFIEWFDPHVDVCE